MPTLILIDSSLSMLRPANRPPNSSERNSESRTSESESRENDALELMDLAKWGIDLLLGHIEKVYKMEHVAILSYGCQCDLVCPFTRDISELRAKITTIDSSDASNPIAGLKGVANYVTESWQNSANTNVIIVTDGGVGLGKKSLKHFLENKLLLDREIQLPLLFPGTLNVILVNHLEEVQNDISSYEKLIELSGLPGQVLVPTVTQPGSQLTRNCVEKCVQTVIDTHFKPFIGKLTMGDEFNCPVTLCPPPVKFKKVKEFEKVEAEIEEVLDIKGFLTLADVASPPVVSRHLILPFMPNVPYDEDSRTANLCVLLHGALKTSSLCALVQVAANGSRNWFGILFSHADSKKKFCLMLALFEPGNEPVPWLGNLLRLGPLDDLNATSQEPFPVKLLGHKPSYSSSPVVWIRQASLQSDIQKVLRHARKMPEKTPHFYKELNRIRKAALSIGFYELMDGVASIFEKECAILPGTAHPECHMQLSHAALELRKPQAYEPDYSISAMPTKHNKISDTTPSGLDNMT